VNEHDDGLNVPYPPHSLLFALADDVLVLGPGYLLGLLESAKTNDQQVAEFTFNVTDLAVDFDIGLAVIHDVLDDSAAPLTLPLAVVLRPFNLCAELPSRCVAFVKRNYTSRWSQAMVWLSLLPDTRQDRERIVTAAVAQSGDNLAQLEYAIELGRTDWRDLLMNTDLANADWPARLDEMLGANDQVE